MGMTVIFWAIWNEWIINPGDFGGRLAGGAVIN